MSILSCFSKRKKKRIRILAMLCCRNEEMYLKKNLTYLLDAGLEVAVIDNDSRDNSIGIIKSFIDNNKPVRIYHHPYNGFYDWENLLGKMERMANELDYDWYVLTAPDEILEAPVPFKNLAEGIAYADKKGYNTINFDELVFIPTEKDESFIGKDYEAEMKYYYFFEPRLYRLNRAWKKPDEPINLVSHGSHKVHFKNQKLYPENFTLKHYIFLSHLHGVKKYSSRIFTKEEITRGWHGNRLNLTDSTISLPSKDQMKNLERQGVYDRSDPHKEHLFNTGSSNKNSSSIIRFDLRKKIPEITQAEALINSKTSVIFILSFDMRGTRALVEVFKKDSGIKIIDNSRVMIEFVREDLKVSKEKLFEILKNSSACKIFGKTAKNIADKISGTEPVNPGSIMKLLYSADNTKSGQYYTYIDITPDNAYILAAVQHFLPQAKFLHVVEDIKAIATRRIHTDNESFKKECLEWIGYIKELRQQSQFCEHFMEVRLEDFLNNPANIYRIIRDFMEAGPEEYAEETRPDRNLASSKETINDEELEIIESVAGFWRKEMGYQEYSENKEKHLP